MDRWHHNNFVIDSYQSIPSTNDLAFELASNNQINNNHVIVAKQQTLGHGRYGRDWNSPKGNLYFSLILRPDRKLEDPSLLSFIAAVSLSQSILNLDSSVNIAHKWPNDILINDKKVAGILLKSSGEHNKKDFIIIGIGVNINSHPKDTVFTATDLKSEKIDDLELDKILKIFLDNFNNFYHKYLDFGFDPIRNIWLKNAFKLGKTIVAKTQSQKVTGKFKDLNNSGNLILEDDNKDIKIISSAEIFS
jgi:BirA family biotin operon repressor/biotin-[acetyl-CoA-carboxylase] ligase